MSTTGTVATKQDCTHEEFAAITEQLEAEFNEYRASIAAMCSAVVDLVTNTYDLLTPVAEDALVDVREDELAEAVDVREDEVVEAADRREAELAGLTLVGSEPAPLELVPDAHGSHGVILTLVEAHAA